MPGAAPRFASHLIRPSVPRSASRIDAGGSRRPASTVLLLLAALTAFVPMAARSGTLGGGLWDLAGSPHRVGADLWLPAGETLVIDPGVEVLFRGAYRFLVNGNLRAVGTASDSIRFTWDAPAWEVPWRGIRLVGADDATRLVDCRIEHVESPASFPEVRGGAIYCESCAPAIGHCLLQHNRSHSINANGLGGGVGCFTDGSPAIEFCVVRDNDADSGGGIGAIEHGTPIIRNNIIADNVTPNSGGGIYAGVRNAAIIENNLILNNTAYGWGGGGITLWNLYAVNLIAKTVRTT